MDSPQATLLAYTDGLVERRGASIDDGIELVRGLLRDNAERPARTICDIVLNTVLTASPADDDMALLLARFTEAGVDLGELAAQLQRDGAKSFVDAWNELVGRIDAQTSAVA